MLFIAQWLVTALSRDRCVEHPGPADAEGEPNSEVRREGVAAAVAGVGIRMPGVILPVAGAAIAEMPEVASVQAVPRRRGTGTIRERC